MYYPKQSTDSVQSLSKSQWHFLHNRKNNPKNQWALNNQNNLEKEKQNWVPFTSRPQHILQSYSNHNSVMQGQTVQWKRRESSEIIHAYVANLLQRSRENTMEKGRPLE